MKRVVWLLIVLSLFQYSCGTIMNGTSQEIRFSSSPRDAIVVINGEEIGETPLYYDLKRNSSYDVTLELKGYHPYDLRISRRVTGWALGNVVFGLLPGIAVDAVTGGLFVLTPEDVHARMRDRGDELNITVVLKPDPNWQKIGNLQRK